MIKGHFRAAAAALFSFALPASQPSCGGPTQGQQAAQDKPKATATTPGSGIRAESLAGIRRAAQPIKGTDRDYDPLMTMVGDARFVFLGESTHGTHEFYRERARITKRLIKEKNFTAIAIEGDWPDAERVNRYVRGQSKDKNAAQALSGFERFPRWMWANRDIEELVEWVRRHNASLPPDAPRVGFYGLDMYSLAESADAAVAALEKLDPAAAKRARERYRCFTPYRKEPEAYGLAALSRRGGKDNAPPCEREARLQLTEVRQLAAARSGSANSEQAQDLLSAIQNARVVKSAEEYYRVMYQGNISSWNLRDKHMAETLEEIVSHFEARKQPGKVVVWAHNTHSGDARMTAMGEGGEWNVGQLMRQRYKEQAVLVGFTTYTGTVMAASEWGKAGQVKTVRPALPESYAALFHEAGQGDFLMVMRGNESLSRLMGEPRLERAIGVLYLPETERASHYFEARLSKQFDAVIHMDTTRAIEPLRR